MLRLDLCCVNPDADGPRHAEYDREDIDGDDDDPAASAVGAVYGITGVEPANQEHDKADPKSTVYRTVPSAPFVG